MNNQKQVVNRRLMSRPLMSWKKYFRKIILAAVYKVHHIKINPADLELTLKTFLSITKN